MVTTFISPGRITQTPGDVHDFALEDDGHIVLSSLCTKGILGDLWVDSVSKSPNRCPPVGVITEDCRVITINHHSFSSRYWRVQCHCQDRWHGLLSGARDISLSVVRSRVVDGTLKGFCQGPA